MRHLFPSLTVVFMAPVDLLNLLVDALSDPCGTGFHGGQDKTV